MTGQFTLSKFGDATKLWGACDAADSCAAIQRDLNTQRRIFCSTRGNKMQSHAPREEQPQTPVYTGANQMESCFAEKNLGVLVDTKLTWASNAPAQQKRPKES